MPDLREMRLHPLLLLCLLPLAARAQAPATPAVDAADLPRMTASPSDGVRLDGVLDDADWQSAVPATDFVQFEPEEGVPASEPTAVRVLLEPGAVVIGAELEAGEVRRALARRDSRGDADEFTVALSTYNDGRTAFLFSVSAAGVQTDAILEGGDGDDSWDAVWDSAVRVTPSGWAVEMRIPYAALRFSERADSWGVQFQRVTRATSEESFWSPVRRSDAEANFVARFGRLDGVGAVRPRRLLQAVPYSLARAERFESDAVAGTGDSDFGASVGADLKVGLTPSIVVDLTVNPDFGQVDADPAELNLSTFETFFPERRPFFLEGTQIFDLDFSGGDGALLYTRRIGGSSPVLGAAKLTGRTAGGLSFGGLTALTGRDRSAERFYVSGRVRQELRGQSAVGAGVSAFGARGTDGRGADGDRLPRSLVGAADWDARVLGGTWTLEGTAAASARALAATPDAPAEREAGGALYVGFDKLSGYFLPGFGFRAYTGGFRLNDVGRFRQTDLLQLRGGARWLLNRGEPVGPFRRLNLGVFTDQTWQLSDGLNRGLSARMFNRGQLLGFQNVSLSGGVGGIGGVDVRETRGLGPVANILRGEIDLGYETDTRQRLVFEPSVELGADAEGGRRIELEFEVDWTASDRLALDVAAELGWSDGIRAWAANEGAVLMDDGRLGIGAEASLPDALAGTLVPLALDADAVAALTRGLPGYAAPAFPGAGAFALPLFGSRDTREADLTLRATYLFSPRLSFQLFGQLFGARGRYRDFRVLAGTEEFRDIDAAYPKRRDFSFASLRGNAVLRWELQRGSALFVVWSQSRGDGLDEEILLDGAGVSPFDRSTTDVLGDAVGAFPDDVFLVKLSWLFGR